MSFVFSLREFTFAEKKIYMENLMIRTKCHCKRDVLTRNGFLTFLLVRIRSKPSPAP